MTEGVRRDSPLCGITFPCPPPQWFSCIYSPNQKQVVANSNMQLYVFEYSCSLMGMDAPADSNPISHVYFAQGQASLSCAYGAYGPKPIDNHRCFQC